LDKRIAALSVSFFLLPTLTYSQTPSENSLVERVGDTGFVRAQGYLRIPLIAWHEHLLLKLSAGSKKSNFDGVGSYTEHFASLFE
jgi:hypothetical protein